MEIASKQTSESIVPTPLQLKLLASMAIQSFAGREKVKTLDKFPSAHFFFDTLSDTTEVSLLNPAEEIWTYHRVAGRVGRVVHPRSNVKLREWSMFLFDLHSVRTEEGLDNVQSLYRFRWGESQTVVADKRVIVNATGPQENIDPIARLYAPEDVRAVMRKEGTPVTQHEFSELTDSLQGYLLQGEFVDAQPMGISFGERAA